MANLLVHFAAVELLAAESRRLPESAFRALQGNLEYARLGAALLQLPRFEGLLAGARQFVTRQPTRGQAVFPTRSRAALGVQMAKLVAHGALVGHEAGVAFLTGYFTHLCVERTLAPWVAPLVDTYRRPKETTGRALQRIEWVQSLFFLRELYGSQLVGSPALRRHMQLVKRVGIPTRGIGRGLYEMIRLSTQEVLGVALPKRRVDRWVRGLYAYAAILGSPLGRVHGLPAEHADLYRTLYQGPEQPFRAVLEQGLDSTHGLVGQLLELMARGRFTARSTGRFMELIPEGEMPQALAIH